MSIGTIEQEFKSKVSTKIHLNAEGIGRYRVFTPFRFDDGDHLTIVLQRVNEQWILSDQAHTYMHLTYDIDEKDLHRGNRQKIISNTLSVFNVEDRDGELTVNVQNDQFGDALYSFVQALLKITDVAYLSRARVESTFLEDFRTLFTESVPEGRRTFDWHHPDLDPRAMYAVDCRINGMPRPLFVHALTSDGKTRDATITLLQFQKWEIQFHSLVIFDDQESINRKVLARLSDVCDKQFSSLHNNRGRINDFLSEVIHDSS